MNSINPVLSERTFGGLPRTTNDVMTLDGTIHKSGLLLLATILTAALSWKPDDDQPWFWEFAGYRGRDSGIRHRHHPLLQAILVTDVGTGVCRL